MTETTPTGHVPGQSTASSTTEISACVIAAYKGGYELDCERGAATGKLKSAVYYPQYGEPQYPFPTTGDLVSIQYNDHGDSTITRTLPRKSAFLRADPKTSHQTAQAIAANFDYCFIVSSMNADFNIRRIERYLSLAWQSQATPVVVLTKSDLLADEGATDAYIADTMAVAAGVDIIAVSTVTGSGMEQLSPYLQPGKTIVLLGSSGVGKSSLVNAIAGEQIMDTGGIREDDARGRHTTTRRQLIRLPSGVNVIDTPGMRELTMWDADEGVSDTFTDIEEIIARCRFSDCRHSTEPGCAVNAAIEDGTLPFDRWTNFQKLQKEAHHLSGKEWYKMLKQAGHKRLIKERNDINEL